MSIDKLAHPLKEAAARHKVEIHDPEIEKIIKAFPDLGRVAQLAAGPLPVSAAVAEHDGDSALRKILTLIVGFSDGVVALLKASNTQPNAFVTETRTAIEALLLKFPAKPAPADTGPAAHVPVAGSVGAQAKPPGT